MDPKTSKTFSLQHSLIGQEFQSTSSHQRCGVNVFKAPLLYFLTHELVMVKNVHRKPNY